MAVVVENTGEVLLEFNDGFTRVQQMKPWPNSIEPTSSSTTDNKTEIEWPLLTETKVDFKSEQREIEPHESDEIHFEFIIPEDVEMVVVYYYLRNVKNLTKTRSRHEKAFKKKLVGRRRQSTHSQRANRIHEKTKPDKECLNRSLKSFSLAA